MPRPVTPAERLAVEQAHAISPDQPDDGAAGPVLPSDAVDQLRAQRHGYADHRQTLAAQSLGLLQPLRARDDLLAHLRPGAAKPQLRAQAARMEQIAHTFQHAFRPAADWLAGQSDASAIAGADLGLIANFARLCPPGRTDNDFVKTLYDPLAAAVRLGTAAGLKVVAIPAFAFGQLQERPAHILSFHSAGHFPGFTHYKRADLPGYLSLDAGGYSGWSSLSGANLADLPLPDLAEATPIFTQLQHDIIAANISKYRQDLIEYDTSTLPRDYVFVALQDPRDRTQATARFAMQTMVDIAVARFRGTGTAVVVKPHPRALDMDQLATLTAMDAAGDIVLRFDGIHTLIAGAQAVITVNSGVGSETLLHRKPIYCFGGADYDAAAHRITSAEQFNALTTPIRPALSDADLIRFTAYYRTTFLVERDRPGRLDQAIMDRVIRPALARN